jgi:hypothetical protein
MKTRGEVRERYEELELERKELRRYASSMQSGVWFLLALGLVINAAVLGGVALLAPGWLLVVAPALVGAQALVAWWDTQARIKRLQAHNLTLHDELLRTQELIVRFVVKDERQDAAAEVVPQAMR